ncbi:hypothetical protein BDW22DRAFT_1427185 [Trametopsis cervina]|nr:hypothetical protein BDW22DRAFT_1427185 [Trametopsis cervina]
MVEVETPTANRRLRRRRSKDYAPSLAKKKQTPLDYTGFEEAAEAIAKKAKKEDKKAPSSTFFSSLANKLAASVDSGSYKALSDISSQPSLIQNGRMNDYQLRGLSYLAHMHDSSMNCVVGDEMGLDNVCPLSVVRTWQRELKHGTPPTPGISTRKNPNARV